MDEIWWKSVPNARRFIEDITEKIVHEESLICNIDRNFPWADTFASILTDNVTTADKTVNTIYAADLGDTSPGEYIKNHYFKSETKMKYRSSLGYPRFIALNDHSEILKDRIIIVKCTDAASITAWHDFVYGYMKYHDPETRKCSFVIENSSEKRIRNEVPFFSADDYFQEYDTEIFSLLILSSLRSESREKSIIRHYTAQLAAMLAGNDVEFAAHLAMHGKKLAYHTRQIVDEVTQKETRSNYEEFVLNGDRIQRMREAQIKVFYPEIEKFRIYLIDKYSEKYLTDDVLRDYRRSGGEADDVYGLELGSLLHLCGKNKLCLNEQDYGNLVFYRECRNKLAHNRMLTKEEIIRLSSR